MLGNVWFIYVEFIRIASEKVEFMPDLNITYGGRNKSYYFETNFENKKTKKGRSNKYHIITRLYV